MSRIYRWTSQLTEGLGVDEASKTIDFVDNHVHITVICVVFAVLGRKDSYLPVTMNRQSGLSCVDNVKALC